MLIIFDLDGTLYKTETSVVPAVRKALQEIHAPIPEEDEIKAFIGRPMDEFCYTLLGDRDGHRFQRFRDAVRLYEREEICRNPQPYPGIITVLEHLAQDGHELAICSNASVEYIQLVLDRCHITKYFTHIKGREDHQSKADRVADLLETLLPSEGVVIGDTFEDVEAAKAHHLPSIVVQWGYGHQPVDVVSFHVQKAAEIMSVIERIQLCGLIHKQLEHFKFPVIIGINGVDTSGKTEFANCLATYLEAKGRNTQVIHLDDFHNPLSLRRQGRNEQEAYIDHAFNLNLLTEAILDPVHGKQAVDVQLDLLDVDTDTYTNKKHYVIDQQTVVIVEGTLLYREPLIERIDYKIYLDISFEEVIRRARQRDVPKYGAAILQKYQQKYIPIQNWYIEKYAPHRICNLVIDNENHERPKVKHIMG